ncbi:trypsin-like serine protease [Streptomyces sp. NPDC101118]|uniref:trypsin-like serine protease n=1 Tax=Streptomyces sp. NPDC101118 TaxID=3366109 RepID=UPI0037FC5A99
MRIHRWLAAATATAAVVLGAPVQTASAETVPPANAGAAFAVEDGAYPFRSAVLAATGADLIAGDGNITHTSCSGPYQIMVWARNLLTSDSRICFRAGRTGSLTVSIPRAYRIETVGRDLNANISIDGETSNLTVPRDTTKGFGEADPADPKRAVLLQLNVTGSSAPVGAGQPIGTDAIAYHAQLNVGGGKRFCSAALVDPSWVIAAKSCFADKPAESNTVSDGAPKDDTTVTVGRKLLTVLGGHTSKITKLVTRADRDLVMAQLEKPATGIAPLALSRTAPAAGETLTVGGYGRTASEWAPHELHTAEFTAGTASATGFDITPKAAESTLCKGDAGGPAVRTENGKPALAGITSLTWHTDCLDGPADETRTGGFDARVDDIRDWIQQTRALTTGWKTEAVVQGGTKLYQAIRLADGTWTDAADVEAKAGTIGGVRASAVAGINGDTHVVALGGDGKVHHTVRKADGTWGSFGDVNQAASPLSNVTQLSAVSIGYELHVVAVANGRPYHTVRRQDGTWTVFGDVTGAAGPIGTVTAVATAHTAGQLQVIAVSGGKAYHTLRATNGTWTKWGDVAGAAGATGPVTAVAMAGTGSDAHVVIATDNGTQQYHSLRKGDGTWTPFGNLTPYLGQITVKSLGAGSVDGELQLAATTADGKVLHTTRRANGTWATTAPVALDGLTGTLGGIALAGTL